MVPLLTLKSKQTLGPLFLIIGDWIGTVVTNLIDEIRVRFYTETWRFGKGIALDLKW